MVAQTHPTDLLETVEERSDKVYGAQEAGRRRQGGLGVGQYPQVVLAYGKLLDTLDLADKWPTPRIGMDVPGGRLQVGSSLRLLITAHCGSARWVMWKGLRIKSPHPYPICASLPRSVRLRSQKTIPSPSKPRPRGTSRGRGIDDGEPIRDNHPIDQEGGDDARRAP